MPGSQSKYRKDQVPELDGIRGLALMMVLWVHLPAGVFGPKIAWLRGFMLPGDFGIDIFFVLSGFLITRILLVERELGVPVRYFMIRRMLRIFPVYYLTIFVMAPRLNWTEITACATYTWNYVSMTQADNGPMGHTWSLAVEEHFYLLWPPIVAFTRPKTSRRVIKFIVFPMAIVSIVLAYSYGPWATEEAAMQEFVFRSSTIRFASLGVGTLLAYSEQRVRDSKVLALFIISIGVALALLISYKGLDRTGLLPRLLALESVDGKINRVLPAVYVLSFPFLSLALVVSGVVWTKTWAPHALLMRFPPLRAAGRISYAVYLFHIPLYYQAGIWGPNPFEPSATRALAVLGLVFLIATSLYWLLERPLLRFGSRFRVAKRRPTAPEPETVRAQPSAAS